MGRSPPDGLAARGDVRYAGGHARDAAAASRSQGGEPARDPRRQRGDAQRAAGCSSVEDAARATIAPKLHVIRFNCDAYVAADGTRVGGLFHATNIQSEADVLKLKPNKSFKPTIERLVDELLRLCESEADDAWFDAQPELRA